MRLVEIGFRHFSLAGHYFFDGQVDETALTTSFWRETRIMTDV
jgi:hypothetical protein